MTIVHWRYLKCFERRHQEGDDCPKPCATCRYRHPKRVINVLSQRSHKLISVQFCPQRYLTWNWYKEHTRRSPREDEGLRFRPTADELEVLCYYDPPVFWPMKPIVQANSFKRKLGDYVEEAKEIPHKRLADMWASEKVDKGDIREVLARGINYQRKEAQRLRDKSDAHARESESLRQQLRDLQAENDRLSALVPPPILEQGNGRNIAQGRAVPVGHNSVGQVKVEVKDEDVTAYIKEETSPVELPLGLICSLV